MNPRPGGLLKAAWTSTSLSSAGKFGAKLDDAVTVAARHSYCTRGACERTEGGVCATGSNPPGQQPPAAQATTSDVNVAPAVELDLFEEMARMRRQFERDMAAMLFCAGCVPNFQPTARISC